MKGWRCTGGPLTDTVPHPLNISHLPKKRKLFHMNFITSPLADHPSKPLFVRRNLRILSEPLAWVSRWGVSQWALKGFQRRGAAISSQRGLHVQGLSWPWSQVGHMQQLNSPPPSISTWSTPARRGDFPEEPTGGRLESASLPPEKTQHGAMKARPPIWTHLGFHLQ